MFKYLAYPKVPTLMRFCAVVILASLLLALVIKARQSIPEVVVETMPVEEEVFVSLIPDFDAITNIEMKKQSFFAFLHQYVDAENKLILQTREYLQVFSDIVSRDMDLSPTEQQTLDTIASEYKLQDSGLNNAEMVEELLVRVDVIPVSLALAQAATESAWGTSRFAREGNNIFGQWCYDEGCGLVPGRRARDASHEVRAFSSIEASVRGYFRNLNTNPSYEYLRELRAQMRLKGRSLDALALAHGLTRYSERGHVYVTEVQEIIRINDLLSRDEQS
ncbi:MAG: glucosaminidase domain-containing protein [Gammaproteobacteria bacterium]|nr:glucosaminidase domain-containing protein [Gammaproteobacteria bacterium]MDP2141004.1 glucosaminidase domain-containing protein [Gammaproteobacteria bacterium]MDP2349252.1 glucosaminidase domain-containing protein [Gammaproteobacteria bacterium]